MSDFCIIGSGPSAISAAVALTRRNLRVTMLDAGRELEESRARTVVRLGSQDPAAWDAADTQHLKEGVTPTADGIPLKRLYGSEFPFSMEGSGVQLEHVNAGVRPSFARAGLSTVWGAGMLPFHADDIADWPFSSAELEQPYREVMSFVPCSGTNDALKPIFPHHAKALKELPPSRQGQAFLKDAAASRQALSEQGITVGQARLAVDAEDCRRCGMCLYGCPYKLIYNSGSTLRHLLTLPNFRYEPGFVVERLHESGGSVEIHGHDLSTGSPRRFEAGRVLLGAGVIPSTAILLVSLDAPGTEIRLQDSFYFLLPLLRFSGVSKLQQEHLHTLAQAFVVMRDPAVCEQFVHFSVYGFNDLMVRSLQASVGPLGGMNALVSRAMVAGGYLHSSLSPGIKMTVNAGRILLQGEDTSNAMAIARKAGSKLQRQAFRLRALAVPQAMRFSTPGRGFHTGGSFPMTGNPVRHTSDVEGRPFGFDRVHLVDASCLPSIPATTITFPVMANAWRIANRAADRA